MCRKNEVDCSFIQLIMLFLPWNSRWQNLQFCSQRSIWSSGWNVPILGLELKRHRIYHECSISMKFPHQSCVLYDSVNFYKSLVWKWWFIGCLETVTPIWHILHLFRLWTKWFLGCDWISWSNFGMKYANLIKLSQIVAIGTTFCTNYLWNKSKYCVYPLFLLH